MPNSPLVAALGYPKFPNGRAPRLLVIRADYYVFEDVLEAARNLGWAVAEVTTQKEGKGSSDFLAQLLTTAVSFKPDFLLSINHLGFDCEGVLASLLEEFGLPLASWYVDHPMPILGGALGNARSNCQVFCIERSALPWLESAGFDEPQYLPTASNWKHFHPARINSARAKELGCPLALVAGSWWTRARESFGLRERELAQQMQESGFLDPDFLMDPKAHESLPAEAEAYGAFQILFAEASMQRRKEFIQALAELEPVVFGDPHWYKLVEDVALRPSIDPVRDLPALFRGSDVNLNVSAAQLPTGLNQRLWDVPGSGGFLLTDAQESVQEHFDTSKEMATYASFEEAVDKARYFSTHESERRQMAELAFERVDAEHRYEARLCQLLKTMQARFASRLVTTR